MDIARPFALLLVVPAVWVLLRWRHRRRPTLRFPSLSLVRGLPRGRAPRLERIAFLGRVAVVALLLLAVLGVRWPDPGSRTPTEGISIALVLDASESMRNLDFFDGTRLMTRWDGVRQTARLFIRGGEQDGKHVAGRPNDLFALVTFARRPETDCPLTLDHDAILGLLDEETPRRGQPTNPGDALAWGLHLLSKAPTQRKVLIFISDGEDNVKEKNIRPNQAAALAKALGVPIYAIEVEPLPEESRPEAGVEARQTMKMLAETTGGGFYPAKDTPGLLKAYAAIDQLERERIESHHYRRYMELDPWFAATSLGVFLLLLLLEATWWRRTP